VSAGPTSGHWDVQGWRLPRPDPCAAAPPRSSHRFSARDTNDFERHVTGQIVSRSKGRFRMLITDISA
jgi:hypothetical protein